MILPPPFRICDDVYLDPISIDNVHLATVLVRLAVSGVGALIKTSSLCPSC